MSVESLITNAEQALVNLIRYGLLWRYPVKANSTALTSMEASVLREGALVYVTGIGLCEWFPFSTTAQNGTTVFTPTTLPSGKTNGRWIALSTSWTFGAGGTNLGAVSSGYLRAVEAYSSDDGPDLAIEKVFGETPSVLVQFMGDDPKADDIRPGTFYKDVLDFQLLIISSNMRPSPAATQGSPISAEASNDPGIYKIIGDLRRLLCGVSPNFGITDIERVEIGPSSLAFEDLDRRLFVWTMQVKVRGSFSIDDEDLVDANIRAQPTLTEHYPSATFDKDNYISSGGGLDEGRGAGLSRTIEATIAKIAGTALANAEEPITFDADSDTYRDLNPDGTWTFVVVPASDLADQPAVTADAMRVGVTRTDSSGVVYDRALCSFSIPFGDYIEVPR